MAVSVCHRSWTWVWTSFKSGEFLHEINLLDPRGWKEKRSSLARTHFNSNHQKTHISIFIQSLLLEIRTHPSVKILPDFLPVIEETAYKHGQFQVLYFYCAANVWRSTISYSPLANFDFMSSVSFNWPAVCGIAQEGTYVGRISPSTFLCFSK